MGGPSPFCCGTHRDSTRHDFPLVRILDRRLQGAGRQHAAAIGVAFLCFLSAPGLAGVSRRHRGGFWRGAGRSVAVRLHRQHRRYGQGCAGRRGFFQTHGRELLWMGFVALVLRPIFIGLHDLLVNQAMCRTSPTASAGRTIAM
jgi:hypothetical protein